MKEKISEMINVFTRVVATIFIFASIYLLIFWGNERVFSAVDILGILFIGLISAISRIPFMTNREYSKKSLFVLNFIYFLIVNFVSLAIGFLREWFSFEKFASILCFELIIVGVYVIVKLISYKIDLNEANEMNKKLNSIQKDE